MRNLLNKFLILLYIYVRREFRVNRYIVPFLNVVYILYLSSIKPE